MNPAPADKLRAFFKNKTRLSYESNERIIRGDDIPSGMYYLHKGMVNKYIILEDGTKYVLQLLSPISLFPLSYLSKNFRSDFFYDALQESVVYKCSIDEFHAFLKESPEMYEYFFEESLKTHHSLLTKLVPTITGSAFTQLATAIYLASQQTSTHKRNVPINFTQEELASQAGVTRETVSREIQEMKERKIVSYKGSTLYVDTHKLSKIIQKDVSLGSEE